MVDKMIAMVLRSYYGEILRRKIRAGSIKAVKTYLQAIKFARLTLMGLFGLGALASVLVAGIVLVVVGIIGLLPIAAASMAIAILVFGALLTAVAGVALGLLFSQRRWLEMSRSHEMIEAVTAPWPGMLPPNPVDVIRSGHEEKDEERISARELRNPELSAYAAGP